MLPIWAIVLVSLLAGVVFGLVVGAAYVLYQLFKDWQW